MKFFFSIYSSMYGVPQKFILLILFLCKILMRFTEYIYLPSFNSIVHILSEISSCDIRSDRQTDRHDKSIRVPLFAIWLRNPKNTLAEKLQDKQLNKNIYLWSSTVCSTISCNVAFKIGYFLRKYANHV